MTELLTCSGLPLDYYQQELGKRSQTYESARVWSLSYWAREGVQMRFVWRW